MQLTIQGNTVRLWRYIVRYEEYDSISGERIQHSEPALSADHRNEILANLEKRNAKIDADIKVVRANMSKIKTAKEAAATNDMDSCCPPAAIEKAVKSLEACKANNIDVEEVDQIGNEWMDGMAFTNHDHIPLALEMSEDAFMAFLRENDPAAQAGLLRAQVALLMDIQQADAIARLSPEQIVQHKIALQSLGVGTEVKALAGNE